MQLTENKYFTTSVAAQPKDTTFLQESDSVLRKYEIGEVTVYGRRTLPKIIPAQELSGTELERLNVVSVADAIRYFSGVQIKDYGGIGGLKTVNIRSMGTQHVGVFYDGIQLGNAQNGQIDLGRRWTIWRPFRCTTGRKAPSSSRLRITPLRDRFT